MKRLYVLQVVENEESWYRPLAYSMEVEKLQQISINNTWYIGYTGSGNKKKFEAKSSREGKEEYPMYKISEVPLVV